MADTKLTDLTAVTTPADTDLYYTSQSSTDYKATLAQIRRKDIVEETASGAQSGAATANFHLALNNATAINYTITGAPTAGDVLSAIVDTTAAHTIILSGSVTWDGTNKTANLATAGDSLIAVARSATRWDVVSNNGVTFSA